MYLNRVCLIGRIGHKDYKIAKNGAPLCCLAVATNRKYFDTRGELRQRTNWHYVNYFNKLADIANMAFVGDLVYAEGELNNKEIETKTGKLTIDAITGNLIQIMLSHKKNDPASAPNQNKESNQETTAYIPQDEDPIYF